MPPHPTPSTAAAQHLGRLQRLHEAGVSIWLDTLSRDLLATGEFDQLIAGSAVPGATSNPTIFAAAITGSERTTSSCTPRWRAGSRTLESCSSSLRWMTSAKRRTGCTASMTQAAVNVTLLFSVDRYEQVIDATSRGWRALRDAGVKPQRPLWASTATKDPAYSDVLYVEELIEPGVINTMAMTTLEAFADHGEIRQMRHEDEAGAEEILRGARQRASICPSSPHGSRTTACVPSATPTSSCLSCIETRLERLRAAAAT